MVDKRVRHVKGLSFKPMYFQKFCKNHYCKIMEATVMKKVRTVSKLIYVTNIFIVVV